MSERQTLAEHGVGLCAWGLGAMGVSVAASPALAPLAVIGALLFDRHCNRPKSRARAAVKRAEAALGAMDEIGERGIGAALQLLKERRAHIAIDLRGLSEAKARGNFPDTLYDTVFAGVAVPKDDGVETALRTVIAAAFEELRLEEPFDTIFQQESLKAIEAAIASGFADVLKGQERAADERAVLYGEMSATRAEVAALPAQIIAMLQAHGLLAAAPGAGATVALDDLRKATAGFGEAPTGKAAFLTFLSDKAAELVRLSAEIAAMKGLSARIDNIRVAAAEAAGAGRLAEARALLDRAREVQREALRGPLETNAALMERTAEIDLIEGKPEAAFTLLSAAADSFAGIDPVEPARRRIGYEGRLSVHGLRFGGPGIALSARIVEEALAKLPAGAEPLLRARGGNSLAITLQYLASRTAGPEGAALLARAVREYGAAREVVTRAEHPFQWARTTQNLASALEEQGRHTAGPEGAALLARAVEEYEAAREVRAWGEDPMLWAMTTNDLAAALEEQASRTGEPEGKALLARAVREYEAAREVIPRPALSVEWAGTTKSLAVALQEQGSRTAGPEGAALLARAVEEYEAAREAFARAEHPVDWAMTTQTMALAEAERAEHDSCADPVRHLRAALAHVEGALEVWEREHMAVHHKGATELREWLLARLGEG